jgi:hypothetical protein
VGPTWQRGEERAGVPVRGRGDVGPGLASGVGPKIVPGVHFYFYFFFSLFFSVFFNFFIPFSNLIQIDSNQLCKVSKIQNNNTEQ